MEKESGSLPPATPHNRSRPHALFTGVTALDPLTALGSEEGVPERAALPRGWAVCVLHDGWLPAEWESAD